MIVRGALIFFLDRIRLLRTDGGMGVRMEKRSGIGKIFRLLGCWMALAGMAGCWAAADPFAPERLAAEGKRLVFGVDDPKLNAGGRLPIGKGQCPFCHAFLAAQRTDRCPSLIGVEALSHRRPREARYKMFVEKYARTGEPDTGIKPHARTGGEYLIESLYCPNCYTPEGLGVPGSDDAKSPMLVINRLPVGLTDFEIVAVAAYLQSKDTPGDFSKVTAKEDWERYFGKKLAAPAKAEKRRPKESPPPMALPDDTPERIVQKMGCFNCHKIPTASNAKIGALGPLLILKTNAPNRIKSPEYRKAVQEGRARAATPREYVVESILHPDAFLVPGFPDDMPHDYKEKFTVEALDKLVDFLLTLDEEAARKQGMDRLYEEKEGSIFKKS